MSYDDFDLEDYTYDRSSNSYRCTPEQAQLVRDTYAVDRDFWTTDMETNKALLQGALDTLHNCNKGNSYSVKYVNSQYGCRLAIVCEPCRVELSSRDPFMTHDQGKKHEKVVSTLSSAVLRPSVIGEVRLTPLQSPRRPADALETALMATKEAVLGLQFVYKEELYGERHVFNYTCQLCRLMRVPEEDMLRHLTTDTHHKQLYLSEKFNIKTKDMSEFREECKKIEEKEGKVICPIVDFTRQFKIKSAVRRGVPYTPGLPSPSRSRSRSRSPSPPPLNPAPMPSLSDSKACQLNIEHFEKKTDLADEILSTKRNFASVAARLTEDRDAIGLLMETLQSLNLRLHRAYDAADKTQEFEATRKYQKYLKEMEAKIDMDFMIKPKAE